MAEIINKNPKIVMACVVLALLVCGYVVFNQVRGASTSSGELFFSDDDGKTWYAETPGTLSPTMHNGKEACRAHVFTCEGKQFVGYLEKFSANAKAVVEQAAADTKAGKTVDRSKVQAAVMGGGLLIKKPGAKDWRSAMSGEGSAIRSPLCSDKTAALESR
jgi:hypothetical protein